MMPASDRKLRLKAENIEHDADVIKKRTQQAAAVWADMPEQYSGLIDDKRFKSCCSRAFASADAAILYIGFHEDGRNIACGVMLGIARDYLQEIGNMLVELQDKVDAFCQ